ncbi:hypothetical protein [uncultured Roseobacter sp.]|uniref:hypothetical protein n=1 Tax=uncultured Roseobacter sp. TaxID=114847 RepID=UPI002613D6F3|nr:hypothetical protein [uncultured Roseobacter sp.]
MNQQFTLRPASGPNVLSAETVWWLTAVLFLASFILMAILQQGDPRLLDGVSIWAKPLKFAISTAIHYGTLACVLHWLGSEWQRSRVLLTLALVSVVFAIGEVGYITFQAAQHMPSHFNTSTPFHALMYSFMAFGAVMVLLPAGIVGMGAAIDSDAQLSTPMRVAVAVGLIGGTVLTVVTAFRLGANMGHLVGVEPEGATSMPFTGWSLTTGDLRPAHFLSTHMMQGVPLVGVIATRFLLAKAALIAVLLFAAGWIGLTLYVFNQALEGRVFVPWMQA